MYRILNFHSVKNGNWFDNIICYLKSRYEFINADILAANYRVRSGTEKYCHITIDDGELSFRQIIYPILKKHNVPVTLFVSPKICTEKTNFWFQEIVGYDQYALKKIIAEFAHTPLKILVNYNSESILKCFSIHQINEVIRHYRKVYNAPEKPFQNLTTEELKGLNKSGIVTLGAHTLSHPILRNENDITSKSEIIDSINGLSNILGKDVQYFSYPNGIYLLDFTEREMNYIRESKIQLAFTTKSTRITNTDDATCIPRIGISDNERLSLFKTKMILESHWDKITRLKPKGEYNERAKLLEIIQKI